MRFVCNFSTIIIKIFPKLVWVKGKSRGFLATLQKLIDFVRKYNYLIQKEGVANERPGKF
jgi:hypothetical protein